MLEQEITLACLKSELEIEALPDKEGERIRSLRVLERGRCKASFRHFLRWVNIIEPPTQETSGGIIKLELWPHLLEVIATFLTKRLITILKARQIGLSYITAAYVLWHAMSHLGSNILLFSKAEDEAFLLLGKSYNIYEQLPEFLKLKQYPQGKGEMGFPVMHSTIKAMSSTESGGASYNASIIVWDEHDLHEYARRSYFHAKPAIDSQGGQVISIFTVNPWEQDTLAQFLFINALAKKNNFTPLFFDYTVRPGRDQAWYERTKRDLTAGDLEGLTPELYMQKNFPRSIQEALMPLETTTAFDARVLNEMMGDVKNPISISDGTIDPKIVHIYQDFHIGEFYIAATDTSHGVGKDDSVSAIMNVGTGAFVADIMHNLLSPEELAFHSVAMLGRYHNPLWYIECNDRGALTIATAQRLGYKHFGYQDEKKNKIGFNTSGYLTKSGVKGTRTEMLGSYVTGVNNHQIKIFNANAINQHYDIIRRADKEGRIEAASGKKDDFIITASICWAKKDEVRTTAWDSTPIESLHFRRK